MVLIAAMFALLGAVSTQGAAQGTGTPSLAMGLNGLADWSAQQPFIDVMKMARPWTGHLPGQWGGWDEDTVAAGGYLDKNGWPLRIPEAVESLGTVILTDLPPDAVSLAGRYRLTYAGEGIIELDNLARNVRYDKGEIWFDFAPGAEFVGISIRATDPRGNGEHIRNIEIVKEEHIPLHEVGAIFNPDWIARIADLRAVRFMDWMNTNDSGLSEWADRPQVADYTYTRRGAPLEIMIALANEIGADPWFNMPHQASDTFMRAFAEQVRDDLDPRLKAHVEYSNEIWNWQFAQAQWAQSQAEARWGAEPPGWGHWMQFAGLRAARMAQIWDDAFGAEAQDRLVKVIATQTDWIGLEEALLQAPLWVAEDPGNNQPPIAYFDAYGVTGYFGYELGTDDLVPRVKQWLAESRMDAEKAAASRNLAPRMRLEYVDAHQFDAAAATTAAHLRAASLSELLGTTLPYHAALAETHGVDLIMYEGGTHIVGIGDWAHDAELTAFFNHFNYTPEMAGLYSDLLTGWKALGGTLFNQFVDVSAPSQWGSWGALRHLDDDNPRWDVLARFNLETNAWWEDRAAGSFDHGVIRAGTPGADTLQGTKEEDILLGGGGDDLLAGGGGADRLHGGEGMDRAMLPGARSDYDFETRNQMILAIGPRESVRLFGIETISFTDAPGISYSKSELY